ncbi:hypothetical protein OESDEN_07925 [Oesophagostomum dentatum]|uniref:Uncharacterized protein n=1 Tax=Oesophagostomum dentatum TaxID=61180 RepID=A0A0B1T8T0_OESDE|nr:hypothetical protein OESDEN_07925 [Oesophagostomum dentatum]
MMLASWIIPLLLCSLLYVYYDCGLIYEDSIYAFVWVPSTTANLFLGTYVSGKTSASCPLLPLLI